MSTMKRTIGVAVAGLALAGAGCAHQEKEAATDTAAATAPVATAQPPEAPAPMPPADYGTSDAAGDAQEAEQEAKISTAPEGALVLSEFEVAQAELMPEMAEQLDALADQCEDSDATILIEGHTDDTGGDDFNDALSLARAVEARDYLVDQGIAAERIEVKGVGATEPLNTNETEEDRAVNRRIEVVVESPKPVS